MAVWLTRAGKHGQHESKFLQDGRVYLTWDSFDVDLTKLKDRDTLIQILEERRPNAKVNTVRAWACQIWPFAHEINPGDLLVLPLKQSQRAIQIGEVTSGYHFEPTGPNPYFHWRSVKWLGDPVPRNHFGQDLLYTFGASLTICRVQRNNAEARLAAMRASGWKSEMLPTGMKPTTAEAQSIDAAAGTDLEEAASDQIAQLIAARFKGHDLTRLVEAILQAQGYTTYRSPAGADGGADILAGAGPLGFGAPRLCVEVKSESNPIDRPTVDKLLGAVTKFAAQEGLFVSWSGYKTNVQKELAGSFFKVRLWTSKELLEALFTHYDQLDADLRAELPLKRIWTVAAQDDD